MYQDIVLIGPISAGKSTIGELLSQRLGWPQRSLDELRWDYYKEIGYDEAIAQQKREKRDGSLQQYWKPFEAHAVVRLLEDCQAIKLPSVIDFGAGYSVYEEAALFQKVEKALAPYPNVVLLLPSKDIEESCNILRERNSDMPEEIHSLNEIFLSHSSNRQLAKITVHTSGKTAEESCEGILQKVHLLLIRLGSEKD